MFVWGPPPASPLGKREANLSKVPLLTRVQITTTDRDHHALWEAVNGSRAGSETIRVSKAALRRLLDDHATLCAPFEMRGLLDKQS